MDAETVQYCRRNSLIVERAMEELEILEMEHPDKFNCLKLELKALISDFESQNNYLQLNRSSSSPISTATQESSSCGKKLRKIVGSCGRMKRRRCETDAVLERAKQCLHKIQHLKTSL